MAAPHLAAAAVHGDLIIEKALVADFDLQLPGDAFQVLQER
jgi:hypothetical protein